MKDTTLYDNDLPNCLPMPSSGRRVLAKKADRAPPMDALMAKHEEFEKEATRIGVSEWSEGQTSRGVLQHVVRLKTGGVIRWPKSYQGGRSVWLAEVGVAAKGGK